MAITVLMISVKHYKLSFHESQLEIDDISRTCINTASMVQSLRCTRTGHLRFGSWLRFLADIIEATAKNLVCLMTD
jgi:hypothetical protein